MLIRLLVLFAFLPLSSQSWGQSIPLAGDILFTHADADGEVFEFITLKRLNLNSLQFTDNGICTNNSFRKNEEDLTFPITGLMDIEAGTLIRVYGDSTGTNELNSSDGIITIFSNALGGFSNSGEQIIAIIGTMQGLVNCTGTGSNSFISGINWGNPDWTAGATSSNTSKAPGTTTDFAETTIANDDAIWFSGSVSGNEATIISTSSTGVRNSSNWSGTNIGSGTFTPLKNILLNESNYVSGVVALSSSTSTTANLNLSNLAFGSTNSNTRYLVSIGENITPSTLVDRYTCYSPNLDFAAAQYVVTAVVPLINNTCAGASTGSGKVVYFNYGLPNSLSLTGFSANKCYSLHVYAINGNGYSANYSSTPASFNFFTGNLVSSLIAY